MSKFSRIKNIIIGMVVIAMSVFMLVNPSTGYYMATLILGVALLVDGIKQFIYFFSMGIHMIGGKMILYRALITMDLSFFYFIDKRNRSKIYDGLFHYLLSFCRHYYYF